MSDTGNTSGNDTPLPRSTLFAFSLPGIMQGFMHAPESQVLGIYAKHAGLSLVALAGALLLTRLLDGITYPLIGYLSDRTFRNMGSRKPWIVAGTVITVTGLWFLYQPPPNVSVTYFGSWLMVTYVGWKLTEIPYSAWGIGLSRDYVQRARIQMWRGMAQLLGGVVFFVVPFATHALGLSETTALNLQSLSFTAMVVALCVPLMNLYSLARVPDGEATPPPQARNQRPNWRALLLSIVRNRPLLRLLAALVPTTLLIGMASGLSFLYVDSYLGLSNQYAGLMLLGLLSTLFGMPFWGWICLHFERHRVWAVSLVLTATVSASLAFVPVGSDSLLPLMILFPLGLFCAVAVGVTVPAMMGDIADFGRLQSGEDLTGMYASIIAFLLKSLRGVATALGLAVAGWLGFDATATAQTAQGIFGIKLVVAWLPALGLACAAPIIWFFPINRASQAATRAAIQLRDAKATSDAIIEQPST